MTHIFTYGSLMYPEVWTQLVAQIYESDGASVCGFRRLAVIGEQYPALIPYDALASDSKMRGSGKRTLERHGSSVEEVLSVQEVGGKRSFESVAGKVYFDVTGKDLDVLDRFEGEQYRRIPVTILLSSGAALKAEVYVWRRRFAARVSTKPWSIKTFEARGLKQFKRKYKGFRG